MLKDIIQMSRRNRNPLGRGGRRSTRLARRSVARFGDRFSSPFEMYELFALTSEEYDVIGEMRTGQVPSTNRFAIFVNYATITHLSDGVVWIGNVRMNSRCRSKAEVRRDLAKPYRVIHRHSDFRPNIGIGSTNRAIADASKNASK